MASKTTYTIQEVLNWIAPLIMLRPTVGIGPAPSGLEPALTSANRLMAMILQPPFIWPWNRTFAGAAITTEVGVSDYPIALETFGFLEKATLVNSAATGATPPNTELEIYSVLAVEGKENQPEKIAILLDDNNGNITFRLFPTPDAIYTVNLEYQNAPLIVTELSETWAPIPDKLSFIYETGLLGMMQMMYNTQLGLQNTEMFLRQLVSAAEGLTETQKALYLEDSLRIARTRAEALQTQQQGKAARV